MHHHDGVVILRSDRVDEIVSTVPGRQVASVTFITIDGNVLLARVRVEEDEGSASSDGHVPCAREVEIIENP